MRTEATNCAAHFVPGGFEASCIMCFCAIGCGDPFGGYEPYVYVQATLSGPGETFAVTQTFQLNYFTGTPSESCRCPRTWSGTMTRSQ